MLDVLKHAKRSNCFVTHKNEEVEKYLVNAFKFICFPSAQNAKLEFRSNNLKATKSVGTGFNISKEQTEDKQFNDQYKHNINFMLMLFKRMKKRLPIPVLTSYCILTHYSFKLADS